MILVIKSFCGLGIEDKIVLDNTPDDKNGSTHNDFPISSKIIAMSSPVPPNPPKFEDTKALIIPKSELFSQNSFFSFPLSVWRISF